MAVMMTVKFGIYVETDIGDNTVIISRYMKIIDYKSNEEEKKLLEALSNPDGECRAYKEAKANNSAYIVEDGWIVRVYADDTRERIKYLGETEVEIKTNNVKL